jgi:hypothetical protein
MRVASGGTAETDRPSASTTANKRAKPTVARAEVGTNREPHVSGVCAAARVRVWVCRGLAASTAPRTTTTTPTGMLSERASEVRSAPIHTQRAGAHPNRLRPLRTHAQALSGGPRARGAPSGARAATRRGRAREAGRRGHAPGGWDATARRQDAKERAQDWAAVRLSVAAGSLAPAYTLWHLICMEHK